MKLEHSITAAPVARLAAWRDFLALTKPRVVWLILMSTAVGFYLGASSPFPAALLFHTIAGTALIAGGTGAFNQWLERDADGKMRRTSNRPLPAGRLDEMQALAFATAISAGGLLYLWTWVNGLTALLGLFTIISYVWVYTPLKSRSPMATSIGAIPGAMPPILGWAAVRNDLSFEGWALFAILFLWQFPHFYAIAWMYREDYSRAGIRMLPVVEPDGLSTGQQIVLHGALLVPVSLLPWLLGTAGMTYAVAALILSLAYFAVGVRMAQALTGPSARRLLKASVIYLPALYCFLIAAKT